MAGVACILRFVPERPYFDCIRGKTPPPPPSRASCFSAADERLFCRIRSVRSGHRPSWKGEANRQRSSPGDLQWLGVDPEYLAASVEPRAAEDSEEEGGGLPVLPANERSATDIPLSPPSALDTRGRHEIRSMRSL